MAWFRNIALLTTTVLLMATSMASSQSTTHPVNDEVSYGNIQDVVTKHVHLALSINFERKRLEGFIEHRLEWKNPKAKQLVLDTRALDIAKVEYYSNGQWTMTPFQLGEYDAVRGQSLTIPLPQPVDKVRVFYASRPEASGLQWLSAEQTASKKAPFIYSQSQAIHARSWMPIQDTPAMRVTYSAHVRSPKDVMVVMSADNSKNDKRDGDYHFTMPQPIPPYLIAIGAGDLVFQSMSKQTGVWAEPPVLESAVAEFNDTQAMIEANETLYGEYGWGQYDLLILPPAFPFGGMENPRLSFITPTVIAGDKSLVNLIAHELAHSWSGNLVTNATWRDLWLNEGFTSYVENRVMEVVFGTERAVMEQWLAVSDLKEEMKTLPADDTRLKLPLNGRDPDDAFSGVPYVKGQLFLMFLEERYGRKRFDPFVKNYFDHFSFQSLTTETFIDYLNKNLIKKYPGVVTNEEVHEWIFEPGLPKTAPDPQSDAFEKVAKKSNDWLAGNIDISALNAKSWSVHEWLFFINELPRDLNAERMAQLDNAFTLTHSTNAEIRFAWFKLAIGNNYWAMESSLKQHLESIGRRKLIVQLYKQLTEHSAERLEWVKKVYQVARPGYHPLAQGTIDALFEKQAQAKETSTES